MLILSEIDIGQCIICYKRLDGPDPDFNRRIESVVTSNGNLKFECRFSDFNKFFKKKEKKNDFPFHQNVNVSSHPKLMTYHKQIRLLETA